MMTRRGGHLTTTLEWGVAAMQAAVILGSLAFSVASLRRFGGASHYGQLFLLNTLGLWLLFCGFAAFKFRSLFLGIRGPGPTVGDVPFFASYVVLCASFTLLSFRFWRARRLSSGSRRSARTPLALVAALLGPAAVLGVLQLAVARHFGGGGPLAADAVLRVAYSALNGACLGAVVAAVLTLRGLGESTLARFYVAFAAAVGLNAIGDLAAGAAAALGRSYLATELVYVVAGLFLVAAFGEHWRQHRASSAAPDDAGIANPYAGLDVAPHETVLRDLVAAHEPLIGAAAELVAARGLRDAAIVLGRPVRFGPDGRVAGADGAEDWDVVLRAVRDRLREAVGSAADDDVRRVVMRHGDEYRFLAA